MDEIYPKILVQRSASQMSQPRSVSQLSQLSQLAGEESAVYPQMMRQRSGSAFSQLGEEMSVYPRVLASNGKPRKIDLLTHTPQKKNTLGKV